jgi:hypothetical protein
MNLNLDIKSFVNRMIPVHKRQPVRLKILGFFADLMSEIYNDYASYRDELLYRFNVTGEVLSLKNFLNRQIPEAGGRIDIIHGRENGFSVQLRSEQGYNYLQLSNSDGNQFVEVALRGEILDPFTESFAVEVPEHVNTDKVLAIVNEYRLAGKSFKIINKQ